MDYRCQYCGRKLDTGLRCQVCDTKKSEIMTTPTKEQIKQVARVVEARLKDKNPYMWALGAILEWEKIRNIPK